MREAQQPMSSFTARQAICAFLIGSGLYTLYHSRFERTAGVKVMTIFLAGMSISYGMYHINDQSSQTEFAEPAEREQADKSKL